MNDRAQKREEFERLWKDPAHVRRWNRQRRGFLRNLRQREFQDADGAWQRDPLPDPIEPVKSNGRRSANKSNRRRKKGDPEFKLPGPTFEDGQLRFLCAERAGASSAQLGQAAALYMAGLKVKAQHTVAFWGSDGIAARVPITNSMPPTVVALGTVRVAENIPSPGSSQNIWYWKTRHTLLCLNGRYDAGAV